MWNLPGPDIARKLQREASQSMSFFGHDCTWRKFISASGGNPEAGIGDQWCYQLRPCHVDLKELTLQERQMIGGQSMAGGYKVSMIEQPDPRDEIIWENKTYRIASEIFHEHIGAVLYWQFIMIRAEVTGQF